MHQFRQLLEHLLSHSTNVKMACAEMTNMTILTPSGNIRLNQSYALMLSQEQQRNFLQLHNCSSTKFTRQRTHQ